MHRPRRPKTPQDAPKTPPDAPRCPKTPPIHPQDAPRHPKRPQYALRHHFTPVDPQDAPKTPNKTRIRLKTAQDAPKTPRPPSNPPTLRRATMPLRTPARPARQQQQQHHHNSSSRYELARPKPKQKLRTISHATGSHSFCGILLTSYVYSLQQTHIHAA